MLCVTFGVSCPILHKQKATLLHPQSIVPPFLHPLSNILNFNVQIRQEISPWLEVSICHWCGSAGTRHSVITLWNVPSSQKRSNLTTLFHPAFCLHVQSPYISLVKPFYKDFLVNKIAQNDYVNGLQTATNQRPWFYLRMTLMCINAPVKVNPGECPPPQSDPRNSDREIVCQWDSSLCHELLLSESSPKRSIFLTFVMSEWCQSDIRKNCCCQSTMYSQTYSCHNTVGGLGGTPRNHIDTVISELLYLQDTYNQTWSPNSV